jgi:hypothetical protein
LNTLGGVRNPTLRRDRGPRHERLGHPYPARDDYRAYLTAEPNAPEDWSGCDQQTSGRAPSSESHDVRGRSIGPHSGATATTTTESTATVVRRDTMDYVEYGGARAVARAVLRGAQVVHLGE